MARIGSVDVPGARIEALLERCTFPPPGTALRCGVSGGADSVALALLARAAGCAVTAVHVDHGLRPGSNDEAGRVEVVAQRLEIGFASMSVEVVDGPNLEARAREARHAALGPSAALGHTADDQAETVLLALLRGTGPSGAAGMRRGPRRPILALRRSETVDLCALARLETVDDPSNVDPRFTRNRVRHEVLPLLADVAGRDVVPLLARHAELTGAVIDHLEDEAARAVPDATDCAVLRAVPEVLAVAALRRWLRSASPQGYTPDAAALERVLGVVRGERRGTELAGGYALRRTGGRLRLEPPSGGPLQSS